MQRCKRFLIAVLLVTNGPAALSGMRLPDAMDQVLNSRQKLTAGTIRWRYEHLSSQTGHSYEFESAYAKNGDRTVVLLGDGHGTVRFEGGNIWLGGGKPASRAPRTILWKGNDVYARSEYGVMVDHWKVPDQGAPDVQFEQMIAGNVPDIRFIGLNPHTRRSLKDRELCLQSLSSTAPHPAIHWSQYDGDGPTVTVEAKLEREGVVRWLLRRDKGGQPETIEVVPHDGPRLHVRCLLDRFGEHWFPSVVERSLDGQAVDRVIVLSAQFDEATARDEFTLGDLGLEPGFNVAARNYDLPESQAAGLFWDGERITDLEGLKKAYARGVKPSPLIEKLKLTGHTGSPYVSQAEKARRENSRRAALERPMDRQLSYWESYTRDFIARYQLTSEQADQARLVLARCEAQASELLGRQRQEFEKLAADIELQSSRPPLFAAPELSRRMAKLLAPLTEIFENSLKPGLERIPTRAQRRAVENPLPQAESATQPAP